MSAILLQNILFSYIENMQNSSFRMDINLEIPIAKWVTITGDCGSGKTTLIKLLAGLLKPGKGNIFYPDNLNNDIGYIFQNPDNQFVHFNIERDVAYKLENQGMKFSYMRPKVKKSLEEVNLWERRNDSPNQLSGGQKQQLALAGMLISDPQVVIFDEPTSFLDIVARQKLFQKTRKLVNEKRSVIWSTHEEDVIRQSDYVIELKAGKVSFAGKSRKYLCRKNV